MNRLHDGAGASARGQGPFLEPAAGHRGDAIGVESAHRGTSDTVIGAGQTYVLYQSIASGYTLTVDGGAAGQPEGGEVKQDGTIANNGMIDLLGGVILPGHSYANQSGAVFEVLGTLNNYGSVNIASGIGSNNNATMVVHGSLTNSGVFTMQGGAGGLTGVNPGGELLIYTGFTNSGNMIMYGAGFANGEQGGVGAVRTLPTATVTNTGTFTILGSDGGSGGRFVTAGVLTNEGAINVFGGLEYSNSPPSGQYGSAGVLDVGAGTIINSGIISLQGGQSDTAKGAGFGATEYQARQDYTLNTGSIILGGGFEAAAATYGTITGARFVQYGIIVNDNTIALDAGQGETGATGKVEGAIFIDSHGTLDNNALITIQGTPGAAGLVPNANAAATFGENGVLTNSGTMQFDGGASADSAVAGTGAVLTIYGQQNVYGTAHMMNDGKLIMAGGYREAGGKAGGGAKINLSGGTLINSGYLELMAGQGAPPGEQTLAAGPGLSSVGAGAQLKMTGGVVINYATFMAGGANAIVGSGAGINVAGGIFKNLGGVVTLGEVGTTTTGAAGMTIGATGTLINNATITGGGSLVNNGVITTAVVANQSSGVISTSELVNNKSVKVSSNTGFIVNTGVTATSQGTFTLSLASTLSLNGAVSNQLVDFTSPGDKLTIGDLSAFGAVLEGLQPKDVIDFANQDVTSAIASGTTLAIGLQGGTTYDLTLSAPLAATTSTQLSSDNAGGTDLLFVRT
jgi:hypothetical protein